MKSLAACLLSLAFLSGCCTCPEATQVTPKPNIKPVVASNKKLAEHVSKIRESNKAAIKTNQDIGADIDSADNELRKLLGR